MNDPSTPSDVGLGRTALIAAGIAMAMVPLNFGVWVVAMRDQANRGHWLTAFSVLAVCQFLAGIAAMVAAVRQHRLTGSGGVVPGVMGFMATVGAPVGWFLGVVAVGLGSSGGGAWGRPLRVFGRQLHPELTEGADWTRGDRPSAAHLDAPTRRALEALWLHDAQKEHASVPAFSRISWLLAAVGAPAELMEWSHRAALEEIEHTRLCFALAAGYSGRCHTVEPMPELLVGGLQVSGRPLEVLAAESLSDGCQLEDFNADVAAACAAVCEEPATRAVLERVAREERSHADFSWALLEWLLERDPKGVTEAIERALASLDRYPRPTAVSRANQALVAAADAAAMRRHGRLPDAEWGALWQQRLAATRARVAGLLQPKLAA